MVHGLESEIVIIRGSKPQCFYRTLFVILIFQLADKLLIYVKSSDCGNLEYPKTVRIVEFRPWLGSRQRKSLVENYFYLFNLTHNNNHE